MASISVSIGAAVGIRNGQQVMPNQPRDLNTITDLLDRIPVSRGGSMEIGGVWASDRTALIAEVAAQITTFQTANNRPVIDGVVDRDGGTLKLMNQLAKEPVPGAIVATVAPVPDNLEDTVLTKVLVAEVPSLSGSGQLTPAWLEANYFRRLVRVEGSSISWFGVVLPIDVAAFGKVPHINFTPTPIQGHYYDATYDSFGGWGGLWNDYTSVIGGQMTASGADQILVLPFYRTAQSGNLGDFLVNWREVVSAVISAAINDINPLYLRDTYTFDRIVTSSFSNGYVAHMNFQGKGAGVTEMTDVIFDLDGQAGGSTWRPAKGVTYLNKGAPGMNPVGGRHWYVGGRWQKFAPFYSGGVNSHAACRNHLLYHGLWQFCT